jgi:hypothetical protein
MKKIIRSTFLAVVLASLVMSLFMTGTASAQTETANPAIIRFDMLGQPDSLLRGPYGTTNIRFGLPANWSFQEGGSLQLIVTANVVSGSADTVADGQFIGSTLSVTFNNNSVTTIPLVAGSNVTYDIPLPAATFTSPFNDGRHELTLFLDAGNDCDQSTTRHTTVVVSSASHFTIPYMEQAPALDLTNLPRPIFQRDSIFPLGTSLVIPDSPTAQEMQAALTVSASLGRMTGGELKMSMIPMSQLNQDLRTNSQLVFVGKASTLSLLQGVPLPSPVQNNAFAPAGLQENDGVLQLAVSPWNTGRAMLVVSGNTDAGVVKAAQALSNETIQTVGDKSLSLIADVLAAANAPQSTSIPQETRTFSELGYSIINMAGIGRSDAFVRFNLPPGFVAGNDTYIDLTFNHSGLLDFTRSGLTVFMNGNLIGSVLLSPQTASTVTQRIKIPPSSLSTSGNELKFEVDLAPISQCSFADFSNLWLSILPESVLHMPVQPATAGTQSLRDLGTYPFPFTSEPTLSNLAFIVSKDDPLGWNAASQVAFHMGRQATGALFNLTAAYDGEIPEDVRNGHNLVIVGLPSNLQIVDELRETLPAPFENGTNVAVVQGQQVAYRFPSEADLGYLELMASPWNAERAILAVLGSTPVGMQQSATALGAPLLRSKLRGNFAMINGESITVADTRTGLGLAGLSADVNATAQPAANATPVPNTAPSVLTGVSWIPMVVGGLALAIFIVLIIAAITRRRVITN